MKSEVKRIESAVEEFKKVWISGMENILKACQIYVKAIDENPEAREDFIREFPKISSVVWGRIERVGRNQMHYLLFCDSSPAAAKIRRLPYSSQKDIIERGVEVLTEDGNKLKVKPENLTPELTKQVIARDHIRDLAEQRAFIESQKMTIKVEKQKPHNLWKVKGKHLHVFAPSVFSRHQLEEIVKDME